MKNKYRWHLLDDCFPKAFSFLAALWAFISNDSVFVVVMQQSFQRAVSTYRKLRDKTMKGSNERFMLTDVDSSHKKSHVYACLGKVWL